MEVYTEKMDGTLHITCYDFGVDVNLLLTGTGSDHDAPTIDGRNIATGMSWHCWYIRYSAMAFV